MAFARIPDYTPGTVNVKLADSASVDAFGRLRTSDPVTLFDSQGQYGLNSLFWSSTTTVGATITHVANQSSVRMSLATTSGSSAVHETKTYWRYQPSKSLVFFGTGIMGSQQSGVIKRLGYYDELNGVFFESDVTGMSVVLRSTTTTATVEERARFGATVNGDPLNGNGPSGLSFRKDKSSIFWADFEWLGYGRVRTGLVDDGQFITAHQFQNTQTKDTPYMTTANLPVRAEIYNTGQTTSVDSMLFTCTAVVSEGGFESSRGPILAISDSDGTTTTTLKPVLSIRPQATYSGVTNHGQVIPLKVDMMAVTAPCYYEVIYDGALSNASFIPVNTKSIVESDVSATAVTGGIRVSAGFVAAAGTGVNARPGTGASIAGSLYLGHDKTTGAGQALTVQASGIGGTATVYPVITWQELY